ncbi:hypothetical protein MRX96_019506 [Rhipicephalus microplus]
MLNPKESSYGGSKEERKAARRNSCLDKTCFCCKKMVLETIALFRQRTFIPMDDRSQGSVQESPSSRSLRDTAVTAVYSLGDRKTVTGLSRTSQLIGNHDKIIQKKKAQYKSYWWRICDPD